MTRFDLWGFVTWYDAPMRRLAGYLFTFSAAVSLLLCIAVCVLWSQSYRRSDSVSLKIAGYEPGIKRQVHVGAGAGGFYYINGVAAYNTPHEARRYEYRHSVMRGEIGYPDATDPRAASFMGFVYRKQMGKTGSTLPYSLIRAQNVDFFMPAWFAAMALGALPGLWIFKRVRRSVTKKTRLRLGLCPACGYDTRATPGQCPECGTKAGDSLVHRLLCLLKAHLSHRAHGRPMKPMTNFHSL
jgi:hypothetical protein